MRRGPESRERLLPIDSPRAVEYGGPHFCYDFPLADAARGRSKLLLSSYGINNWVYNPPPNVQEIQGRPTKWNWRSFNVSNPAQVPLFADSMWRGGGPRPTNVRLRFNGEWAGYDAESHHFAIARHRKGINLLFFDGSVRYSSARGLWNLPWHREYDVSSAGRLTFPDWMRQSIQHGVIWFLELSHGRLPGGQQHSISIMGEQPLEFRPWRLHKARVDLEVFHPAGRESEFEVTEGALAHGHQAARTGVLGGGKFRETPQAIVFEFTLDPVGRKGAFVLMNQTALALAQHVEQVICVKTMAGDAHRQAADELGFQAVSDEVGS